MVGVSVGGESYEIWTGFDILEVLVMVLLGLVRVNDGLMPRSLQLLYSLGRVIRNQTYIHCIEPMLTNAVVRNQTMMTLHPCLSPPQQTTNRLVTSKRSTDTT